MTTATLMAARYETATPHDESQWDSASTDDSDPAFDQGDRDTTWTVTAATTVYELVVSSELAVPTTVLRSDWPFVWPLCATLALTVAILATNADMRLAELMFDRNTGQWALASNSLFKFIYHYGPLPGVAVGVAAAVVAVVGRWTPQRRVWWQSRDTRRACVFLAWCWLSGRDSSSIPDSSRCGGDRARRSACNSVANTALFPLAWRFCS